MSNSTTRVGYLVNGNLRNKWFSFDRTDLLIYAGDVIVECTSADTDLTVCERVFAMLNRDDRPFGQTAPSMSTGDVVCLSGGATPGHRYYVTDSIGFSQLDEPPIEFVPDPGQTCADVLHNIVVEINREAER